MTDGLCSYPAAMKEIGNADRHEVGRRLNNRAENSHQPFRRRERAMQRFRSAKTLQKFSSIHAQIYNHFNQERHLVTRKVLQTKTLQPHWPNGAVSRPSRGWVWSCCAIRIRPAVSLTKLARRHAPNANVKEPEFNTDRGGARQQGRAHRLRADDEGRPVRRSAGRGLNERSYSIGSFRRRRRSASRAPTK